MGHSIFKSIHTVQGIIFPTVPYQNRTLSLLLTLVMNLLVRRSMRTRSSGCGQPPSGPPFVGSLDCLGREVYNNHILMSTSQMFTVDGSVTL